MHGECADRSNVTGRLNQSSNRTQKSVTSTSKERTKNVVKRNLAVLLSGECVVRRKSDVFAETNKLLRLGIQGIHGTNV